MSAELRNGEAGTRGIRRILRKELSQVLQLLDPAPPLSDEDIHQTRKSLKNIRAGLRLLRDILGDDIYERENACFRDAAKPLTEVRDAAVLMGTLDALVAESGEGLDAQNLAAIRAVLVEQGREVRQRIFAVNGPVVMARNELQVARQRLQELPVGRHGWSILGKGLRRVYRKGREAFDTARSDPSVANLHGWRKQAKYLWNQLEMLRPVAPHRIGKLADQAHDLGDLLGDDHDLAVLRQKLAELTGQIPDASVIGQLQGRIDTRREELQKETMNLGERIYDDRPGAFANRLHSRWRAWNSANVSA
jgi:CHAD domain-containing protein